MGTVSTTSWGGVELNNIVTYTRLIIYSENQLMISTSTTAAFIYYYLSFIYFIHVFFKNKVVSFS